MIACSIRKVLTQVCVSFQREQTIVVKVLPVTLKLLLQLQDSPQLARIVLQWLIPLSAEPIATSSTSSAEACLDPADYFCVKFAALSPESTDKVDFNQIIDAFAGAKPRRFSL